jgi:hypothetical protein
MIQFKRNLAARESKCIFGTQTDIIDRQESGSGRHLGLAVGVGGSDGWEESHDHTRQECLGPDSESVRNVRTAATTTSFYRHTSLRIHVPGLQSRGAHSMHMSGYLHRLPLAVPLMDTALGTFLHAVASTFPVHCSSPFPLTLTHLQWI